MASRLSEQVLLYFHPSMSQLATSIAEQTQEHGTHPTKYRPVQLKSKVGETIQWSHFKDGWPNLFIDDVKHCAGRDVIFLASFHSPQVVFEQLSVIYAFPRYLARSFTLILPFFPTGTMERVDTEGQIATARTLTKLLSVIPLCAQGPAQILIFDIHALQERFYFTDNVIPRMETAIPLLLDKLQALDDHDNIAIAFPDDGAYKRFHAQFEGYPTITCTKVRDGEKRLVTIKEGAPKDHHVVIVDDIVMTGGTLIECGKALHKSGAAKISAFVTHAVFPQDSWKRFTPSSGDSLFTHFWLTDSIPSARALAEHKPFELLSLSMSISKILLSYDLQR